MEFGETSHFLQQEVHAGAWHIFGPFIDPKKFEKHCNIVLLCDALFYWIHSSL